MNADREPVISLLVRGENGQTQDVSVIVDTGFNGSLTLPTILAIALGLPLYGQRRAMLADGSERIFDVYRATVIWESQPRDVLVNASDTEPLLGMRMLYGYELLVQAVDGGIVTIRALP